MREKLTYLILTLTIAFTACNQVDKESDFKGQYFDLKEYFRHQKNWQLLTKTGFEKTITMDGKTETTIMPYTDTGWMDLFLDMDINKPAFKDRYHIDSFQYALIYKAKDSGLRVTYMEISLDDRGEAEEVRIEIREEQPIYTVEQTLIYNRRKFFEIKVKQNAAIIGKSQPNIVGKFIKKNVQY